MRPATTATLLLCLVLAGCSLVQPWWDAAKSAIAPTSVVDDRAAAQRYCLQHTLSVHSAESGVPGTPALSHEVAAFRLLLAHALAHRVETAALARRLRGKIAHGVTLSGHDLAALREREVEHLVVRADLFRVAAAHECWLDAAEFGDGRIRLSPTARLKGLMLSLSAALVLYDNYLLAMALYQDSSKLRRYLNNRDVGYGIGYGELNRAALSFASVKNRERVKRALAYYEREREKFSDVLAVDEDFRYLDTVITQSPSYNVARRRSLLSSLGDRLAFFGVLTTDTLLRLKDEGLNLMSMLFGDMIGLVESRRGRLYGRPAVLSDLERVLRAGDILLERTPFRLTNAFIPGHWGHSALWVGTERELRDLGIWDHPSVARHHAPLRQNRLVAEALRSGVKLNTLQHFLNVDDIAVLRLVGDARGDRSQAVIQTLRQVGKRYDFNFDIETMDRIVCSELIYHAYTAVDWPTHRFLGRSTISPDDIAVRSLAGDALKPVTLYHDGAKITTDLSGRMARLLHRSRRVPGSGVNARRSQRDARFRSAPELECPETR